MFSHLSCASAFSFKYGTTQPQDLIARAAQFGAPALAITDRDSLAGVIRFVRAAKDFGIAPIVGVNLQLENFRVTLLAQSDGGWRSLCRLMSALRPDRNPPTLHIEKIKALTEYTSNLILLHGPDSEIANLITKYRPDQALQVFNKYRPYFADSVIECVSHLAPGDGPRSTGHAGRMLGFARDHDLPAVITNGVRMLDATDGPIADILDASRKLVPLHKRHVERANNEAYLKSNQAMRELADEISRAAGERNGRALLRTTQRITERCILSPQEFGLGGIELPEPEVVGVSNYKEMRALLRNRCELGLNWRYSSSDDLAKARARLDDELATVATLGYESYFLTVADVADMARGAGIRVAARGSGAGSLICHLLGISGVDPIRYGLLMERFCSPLRRALPDIDIDVESARRLEIYDLVFKKYQHRTATVAMLETYRARHAIRDTGAALGMSQSEIDLIAKSLPHIRARNISKALESLPELRNLNINTPLAATAIKLAERLDGLPRNLAMHPCAVVLSNSTLPDRTPMLINASGYSMVEFDKDDVEAIGLLKLDILGVRMQSAIAYAVKEVQRTEGRALDIEAVPLDDVATYKLIQTTRTIGLFQIESPGQRELVGKLQPNSFEDLIIDISLFRPGPVKSDMITPFLNARHGFKPAQLIHPDLHGVLAQTQGVVVFHEQVIQIISIMTGISYAEADEKRRELGDFSKQQEICDWFYERAAKYPKAVVDEIWNVLRAFASFGFCKAHAAAFALPTYQSAWLKTHHPAAFIAGLLTHDPGMYPKRLILDEARQMEIAVLPVDVNKSDVVYKVEGNGIRLALSDISGISDSEAANIVRAQPYLDLTDFVRRAGASLPVTEKLIMVGAFDLLHNINRRDLLLHLADINRSPAAALPGAQLTFGFKAPDLKPSGLSDLNLAEKVQTEIETLGMEVTSHMLSFYGKFLNAIGAVKSSDLLKQRSGSSVLVAGVKVALQQPPVRSGKRVIFLSIDDGFGCSDATFFTDTHEEFAQTLFSSQLLLVRGIVRRTGPKGISIRATGAWDLSAAYESFIQKKSNLA
ncbi:MAG: DNA polymerase III subunit alpha [Candidatus Nanopelagicaceae bacterium]